jgi:hypothetical protein
VDEEMPVEARDLEGPPRLETRRGETESLAVGHPRARLDQHAEGRRVDEPDLPEVDDEHLRLGSTCLEQRATYLLGVVEIELTRERDDHRAVAAVHSGHRRFAS